MSRREYYHQHQGRPAHRPNDYNEAIPVGLSRHSVTTASPLPPSPVAYPQSQPHRQYPQHPPTCNCHYCFYSITHQPYTAEPQEDLFDHPHGQDPSLHYGAPPVTYANKNPVPHRSRQLPPQPWDLQPQHHEYTAAMLPASRQQLPSASAVAARSQPPRSVTMTEFPQPSIQRHNPPRRQSTISNSSGDNSPGLRTVDLRRVVADYDGRLKRLERDRDHRKGPREDGENDTHEDSDDDIDHHAISQLSKSERSGSHYYSPVGNAPWR